MPRYMAKIMMAIGLKKSMNNDEQANKFLYWINSNYDQLKAHHKAYCLNKKQQFDEDTFCNTYLKIYEKIRKDGIEDDSENGFKNYMFKAFKINSLREKQYASYQKRDENAAANLSLFNELYLNAQLTEREKLKSDLFKDYSCLYLLKLIEKHFPYEDCRLFKIKLFENLTYKQLQEKTNIKGARQKIVDIKHWLQNNVTKEEIKKAFDAEYGDLVAE